MREGREKRIYPPPPEEATPPVLDDGKVEDESRAGGVGKGGEREVDRCWQRGARGLFISAALRWWTPFRGRY